MDANMAKKARIEEDTDALLIYKERPHVARADVEDNVVIHMEIDLVRAPNASPQKMGIR